MLEQSGEFRLSVFIVHQLETKIVLKVISAILFLCGRYHLAEVWTSVTLIKLEQLLKLYSYRWCE